MVPSYFFAYIENPPQALFLLKRTLKEGKLNYVVLTVTLSGSPAFAVAQVKTRPASANE
ncbi:hypothetical protein KUL152_22960 [Tenacibaculum sp. KUL152]|nr:hypothetical protein KUL152_22960 [Tenacibaculum sp. KUL152]